GYHPRRRGGSENLQTNRIHKSPFPQAFRDIIDLAALPLRPWRQHVPGIGLPSWGRASGNRALARKCRSRKSLAGSTTEREDQHGGPPSNGFSMGSKVAV